MKLFASILTAGAITGSIWGLVLFQPVMAESAKPDELQPGVSMTQAHTQVETKLPNIDRQYLNGVTKSIALESMSALWGEFEGEWVEQNKLPENLNRIVVLYQDLNSDFTQATVTIGYVTPKQTTSKDLIALPVLGKGNEDVLASRGQYSVSEFIDAWGRIDFKKSVDALVEVHYLSPQGQPESSQLSVYYK
ncbi:hypothetical protein [Marinomonas sp. PE14-40]|uniref:hypothetical protein n=1 Tax=Marinomonas sp. PE14-40 TaxID=3060621 RepID=UPI003F67B570